MLNKELFVKAKVQIKIKLGNYFLNLWFPQLLKCTLQFSSAINPSAAFVARL